MAPWWPGTSLLSIKAPRKLVFLFTLSLSVTYLFYSLLSCYSSLQFPLQDVGIYLQPDSGVSPVNAIRTASLKPDISNQDIISPESGYSLTPSSRKSNYKSRAVTQNSRSSLDSYLPSSSGISSIDRKGDIALNADLESKKSSGGIRVPLSTSSVVELSNSVPSHLVSASSSRTRTLNTVLQPGWSTVRTSSPLLSAAQRLSSFDVQKQRALGPVGSTVSRKSPQEVAQIPFTAVRVGTLDSTPILSSQDYSTLDRTPILSSQDYSTLDRTPILSSQDYSTLDRTPILSSQDYSTLDRTPILSSQDYSTLVSTPILSSQDYSTLDSTPIISSQDYSTLDSTAIEVAKGYSTLDSTPILSSQDYSTLDSAPIEVAKGYSTLDSVPILSSQDYNTLDSAPIEAAKGYSTLDSVPILTSQEFITLDSAPIVAAQGFSIVDSAPIVAAQGFSTVGSAPIVTAQRSSTLDSASFSASSQGFSTLDSTPIISTAQRLSTSDSALKIHLSHADISLQGSARVTKESYQQTFSISTDSTAIPSVSPRLNDFSTADTFPIHKSNQDTYMSRNTYSRIFNPEEIPRHSDFTGNEMHTPLNNWGRTPLAATEMISESHTGFLDRDTQESSTTEDELSRRLSVNSTIEYGEKKLPQAIIIGVKKGGTRALLEALRAHPDVRAVGVEPHFFDRNYEKGLEWYRDLMPRTVEGQITMEKTPSYFVTNEAPQRIHSMAKDTKLIVVVRNPVTRAISDYTQTLSKKPEIPTFEVLAFKNRTLGLIDASWSALRIGIYALHLESWMQYFPLSQILFVSGESLISNPAEELAKVQDFLGLQRIITDKHFYFNKTKGFPCLKKPEDTGAPRCLGKSKGRTHPKIDPDVIKRLRKFYKPFNAMFYQMTGQDFQWEKGELES
ncbi:uncharacterized protein LOC142655794 [Rhinoderma darwinii]|uniref:uncharacterized protein LOC142655794 n=1 Tax=Rhinoderma darwinii TaxID=43563 RepID=UPI003F681101